MTPNSSSRLLRKRVAREAALLLYSSQEKEYKQAKERAAETLGIRVLPTNREVAEELDAIAEELEGRNRQNRLIRMRKEALDIMCVLKSFHPKLVGSVWRGTAHRNSDIDIAVFSEDPNLVVNVLNSKGFRIEKTEFAPTPERGKAGASFHVFVRLPSGDEVEVVIRDPEQRSLRYRCEIYGDTIKGLDIEGLRKVLAENPLQTFVPKRRS